VAAPVVVARIVWLPSSAVTEPCSRNMRAVRASHDLAQDADRRRAASFERGEHSSFGRWMWLARHRRSSARSAGRRVASSPLAALHCERALSRRRKHDGRVDHTRDGAFLPDPAQAG
jgi:hypothetical protein